MTLPFLPSDADAFDGPPPVQPDAKPRMRLMAFSAAPPFLYLDQVLTLAEFAAYVQTYTFGQIPPSYLVLHHTANPDASWAAMPGGRSDTQWDRNEQGMTLDQIKQKRLKQVRGIRDYYRDTLHWDRGPHLFADDQFVFLFTPMFEVGIHAAQGNSTRVNGRLAYSIGIEIVGCYSTHQWPVPIQAMVNGIVGILEQRLGTFKKILRSGPGYTGLHRYYNKPSCPGDGLSDDFILRTITMTNPVPAPAGDGLPTPLPYIGVSSQAIDADTFTAVLRDHHSPLADFGHQLYAWAVDLGIAADVWLAQTAKESSFGSTGLSLQLCNPLNIRSRGGYPGVGGFMDFSGGANGGGGPWLGAVWSMLHLKLMYGADEKYTLEDIVPIFAPASDGNNPVEYKATVRRTVADIRKRAA